MSCEYDLEKGMCAGRVSFDLDGDEGEEEDLLGARGPLMP
jgi:hypothetical protein